MADNWITIPTIVPHAVSTTDEWNKFVSNINLLKYPNRASVKLSGTEATEVYAATSGLLSFQSANLRVSAVWAGKPVLFAWKYQLNGSVSGINDIDLYLCNNFNSEIVLLPNLPFTPSIDNDQITSGFRLHAFTTVPTVPTETEWWIEMRNARNTGTSKTASLKSSSCPFLFVMEWP